MIELIHFATPVTGNFLVNIIKWLIQISSSIAVGVILFTLILKLITLPFDFFSRVSMRKNSLKMEQMRPELEKLQKQYANDKDLYNQKMMALYKKNGYSMWGSCLPTIITLVIFIVAINAFTSYSQYQNREYFYDMSLSYNNAVYAGLEEDGELIKFENGTYKIDYESIYDKYVENGNSFISNDIVFNITAKEGSLSFRTENGYIEHEFNYTLSENDFVLGTTDKFIVITDKLDGNDALRNEKNNYLKIKVDGVEKTFTEYAATTEANDDIDAATFIKEICQEKSAETFRKVEKGFLWVKNIWVTDSPMAHPIESSWDTFKSTYKYNDESDRMTVDDYNNLIAKLDFEKSTSNGYFILAVLTAGISFLSQFVVSKSQKSQMELQTVDGQGAKTQKMMMWMMPIMMAFFSFMYTAAFSIYMIISSVFSILTTLGINWIVDKKFEKQLKNQSSEKIRGRIYTPEEKEEDKKNKSVKNNNGNGETGDFITGTDNKKHIRGRLK